MAMAATDQKQGSARVQGELWGARAQEWADYQEPLHRPLFQHAIKHTGIGPGSTVLDVGCGPGGLCLLAAAAGAHVTGIDAAAPSVEIARRRVPSGRFDVGDLQFLPYDDRSFDVVTGFNSFQYAADPVAALAEARRVAKPGAPVYVLVWGREEQTELVALLRALRPLLPPAPPGAPGPFALSYPGALDGLLERAGLTPKEDEYIEVPFEFPDRSSWLRAAGASGPAVLAERTSGPEAVAAALTEAIAPYRTASGSYRIATEWRYVIARRLP
ncbi:MAG: class I SAM-dependent methyltransferase [Chloroflexi bacterium]|nr:class I SAM-dependent methyltransferase [Chloroflexota bacterium]